MTPDTSIGRQLKKKLSQEIESKYGSIESVKLYACATLVDPRYKKFAFRSIRECAQAITHIGRLTHQEQIDSHSTDTHLKQSYEFNNLLSLNIS